MTEWAPKRFWTEARHVAADGGWAIRLDGRPVMTPGKRPLAVPTEALARAIAAEWAAQGERIDPAAMPVTRSANSAIEKVAPQRAEVAAMLAGYGATDLLCYRAERPEALVALQAERWDPLLDWAAEAHGARLATTAGVMPVPQDAAALARLAAPLAAMSDFRLTGMHDLVALSGSLVLALAVVGGRLEPDAAWALSRLDEDWQAGQWGRDEEAEAMAASKRRDFGHAARFERDART